MSIGRVTSDGISRENKELPDEKMPPSLFVFTSSSTSNLHFYDLNYNFRAYTYMRSFPLERLWRPLAEKYVFIGGLEIGILVQVSPQIPSDFIDIRHPEKRSRNVSVWKLGHMLRTDQNSHEYHASRVANANKQDPSLQQNAQ